MDPKFKKAQEGCRGMLRLYLLEPAQRDRGAELPLGQPSVGDVDLSPQKQAQAPECSHELAPEKV